MLNYKTQTFMKTTEANTPSKSADKRAINISWNSRLFFQIGVITSLLFVFFIMQTDFEAKSTAIEINSFNGLNEPPMIEYVIDLDIPEPKVPVEKEIKKQTPVKKVIKSNAFEVKPNSSTEIESPIASTDLPIVKEPVVVIDEPVISGTVETKNIMNVEFVPIFPGCELLASNSEKVDCMSSKINAFINKNFRKELLEGLNKNEVHRIYVKFKIDTKGYITDVIANSHNVKLKNEAQRVIADLPMMKPGKQGDKNVDVIYTVPIVFKIQ